MSLSSLADTYLTAAERVAAARADRANDPARIASRFWSKVRKEGPTLVPALGCCWVWTGARVKTGNARGYGQFRLFGKTAGAHRAAWFVSRGALPSLCVLHKCDGGPAGCVRPDHLVEGTHHDNSRDMATKGRHRMPLLRGERHPRAKLTNALIAQIRERVSRGETRAAVARDIGVSRSAVSLVIRGRVWGHAQ